MARQKHEDEIDRLEREERLLERETGGSTLVAYAAIKYFSYVVITIAILYFMARWVLPMLAP
ncbi:MAG: hypothetical protein WD535_03475 [Thermaerobacterales bacterium]